MNIIVCMPVYVFIEQIFVKNSKFRMKCVNKYGASAKG